MALSPFFVFYFILLCPHPTYYFKINCETNHLANTGITISINICARLHLHVLVLNTFARY